jgi:hypothetical protein
VPVANSLLGIARTLAMQRSQAWLRTSTLLAISITLLLRCSSSSTLLLKFRGKQSATAWKRANPNHTIYIVTLHSSFCGLPYGVCPWLSDQHDRPKLTIYIVPSIMVAWGIVMTLMSLVKSFQGLVVCVLCGPHVHSPPNLTYHLSIQQRTHFPRPDRSGSLPRCDLLYLPMV